MAPQRRALPRGPESAGPGPGRGARRHSSSRKGRFQQDPRGKWLKAAILLLLSAAAGGGLVVWSRLRGRDEIPEGGIPSDGLTEGGIPSDGLTEGGIPSDGLTEGGIPSDGLTEGGIPSDGLTEGGIPSDGLTEVLAHRSDTLQQRFVEVPCSEDYESHRRFAGCTPRKCGRGVTDAVITREEAERIRRIAERGLSLGGSDGGASILDLHSGALSLGKHFVNLYRYFGDKIQDIFTEEDFALYRDVRQRIQQRIAQVFGISSSALYLTKPTFFSRMNSTGAKTTHDEYWHPHVDKVTYGSFDYTSLLYLSDYSKDFGGGRFVFMDADSNKTVEPRAGRVSFFTSGSENLHRVERVRWGTRFAVTISFSCDPRHGIADPLLP
ncbi:2-oxoglutarate and iron-dependent oxygenase domain-containing protein 3 isoform X2 [Onychostruthus taczanowskii]|uniref:2-oxoglutarate and iron-dependent oxygenase domain-containing protein 3 isoform X2 n=1 Tax=Onychostruthus taczanowskii TaxID=356909 RepID=UPI001B80B062|nr:2-oxoglutarate and iron-dependent oxygenase domain-containing protein 3 isoform X2 [Onychostruthus taczanowskii]